MFRKTITAGLAVAMLAVPTAAMADAPTPRTFTVNENAPAYQDLLNIGDANVLEDGEFKGSLMGEYNSRVKQQGWYISDQAHDLGRTRRCRSGRARCRGHRQPEVVRLTDPAD